MDKTNSKTTTYPHTFWRVECDAVEHERTVMGVPLSQNLDSIEAAKVALANIREQHPGAYIAERTILIDPARRRASVDAIDIADDISKNLAHLKAMLNCAYGAGAEMFHVLSQEVRDDYIWACCDKAGEVERLWKRYCEAVRSTTWSVESPATRRH